MCHRGRGARAGVDMLQRIDTPSGRRVVAIPRPRLSSVHDGGPTQPALALTPRSERDSHPDALLLEGLPTAPFAYSVRALIDGRPRLVPLVLDESISALELSAALRLI